MLTFARIGEIAIFRLSRAIAPAESSRLFVNGRARSYEHHDQESTRPSIDHAVTTDACGPESFEFAPQRFSNLVLLAKRVDHRSDLPTLVRMCASDGRGRIKAQRYLARRADRFVPRCCPKTSS